MSVGVMEDYKLRDLRASHTLGPGRKEDGSLKKGKKKKKEKKNIFENAETSLQLLAHK
jgi:hypothetical protein